MSTGKREGHTRQLVSGSHHRVQLLASSRQTELPLTSSTHLQSHVNYMFVNDLCVSQLGRHRRRHRRASAQSDGGGGSERQLGLGHGGAGGSMEVNVQPLGRVFSVPDARLL